MQDCDYSTLLASPEDFLHVDSGLIKTNSFLMLHIRGNLKKTFLYIFPSLLEGLNYKTVSAYGWAV